MPDFAAEYTTPDIHIADNRLSRPAPDHKPLYPVLHRQFAYNPRTWKTMYIALRRQILRRRDTSNNEEVWEYQRRDMEVVDPVQSTSGNEPTEYGSRVQQDHVDAVVTNTIDYMHIVRDIFNRMIFMAYDKDYFSQPAPDDEFPDGYPHGQFIEYRHSCGSIEKERERIYTPSYYFDQQGKQGLEERIRLAQIESV